MVKEEDIEQENKIEKLSKQDKNKQLPRVEELSIISQKQRYYH